MIRDMEGRFKIDFFELMFLAEACIPPRPIARTMFWKDLIDKYYFQMTTGERRKAFEWLSPEIDVSNEDARLFYDRFNPLNQYLVTAVYEGEKSDIEAFLHKDRFHTDSTTSIVEDYITDIVLNYKEDEDEE